MKLIFFDIDNTILDFDEYVRQSMRDGFNKFNLKEYEPWMYDVFTTENNKLWKKIEEQRLDFEELKTIRWNIILDSW